jgi:transposase
MDVAAICEAVTRPSMRFVGVRARENQAALMRHKTRARDWSRNARSYLTNNARQHSGDGHPAVAPPYKSDVSQVLYLNMRRHVLDLAFQIRTVVSGMSPLSPASQRS